MLEEIARGGMGVVWKARQVSLHRTVAVKMLPGGQFTRPEVVQRFRAEAQAAANLNHPNIVAIHEIGEHNGQPFFSMDYVAGPNLATLARERPLPAQRAAAYLKTVARAVHHAHQHGVIHRDLKPANILIDPTDQPRVTDFGLAKRLPTEGDPGDPSSETGLTLSGQVLGTPGYMSPEQAGGRRGAVGAASDVYSLGAVLYFLVTGRAPFAADSLTETLRQVQEAEPVAPRLLNPAVPPDLETIVLTCLNKEPARRYGSAEALANDLTRFLNGDAIHARPTDWMEKSWRRCRRRPAVTALVLGLFVTLVLGLSGVLWQWSAAKRAAHEARSAELATATNLWNSLLSQGRAIRRSGQAGGRTAALAALGQAAALRSTPELRDEAIAALALGEVRSTQSWNRAAGLAADAVAYTHDLSRYAIAQADGGIRILQADDRREVAQLPAVGSRIALRPGFSPDGRWLVARDPQDRVHVWNVPGRRMTVTGLPALTCDFMPDNRQLLVADPDARVALHTLADGARVRQFTGAVAHAVLSVEPRGRWFAGRDENYQWLNVHALPSGERIKRLLNPGAALSIGWCPERNWIAVGGSDGRVLIHSLPGGGGVAICDGHEDEVISVAFDHAGTLFSTCARDGRSRLWESGGFRPWLSLNGSSSQFRFAPGDRQAGPLSHAGAMHLLDLHPSPCFSTGAPGAPSREGHWRWSLDISPDGRWAALGHWDAGFTLWSLVDGRLLGRVPAGARVAARFAGDGRSVVTTGEAGLCRWPLALEPGINGDVLRVGPVEVLRPGLAHACASSRDGRWLAAADPAAARVVLADLSGPIRFVELTNAPRVAALAFSPDGQWLAGGMIDGPGVKVWDVPGRQLVRHLPVDRPTHSEFRADDGRRSDIEDSWDLDQGNVEFSPDGRWLGIGGAEYHLWETATWTEVRRLPHPERNASTAMLAFSPGNTLWALAWESRDLRLVDPATGRVLATLEAPNRPVLNGFRFTPDGLRLVAVQQDRQLQFWDLRRLRMELAKIGLDWDMPAYPPEMPPRGNRGAPVTLRIEPGAAGKR